FAYLATNRLPKIEEKHFEDAQIAQAFKEIADRRPDKDIAPLVLKISDDALERALSVALENTSNFEKAGDAVGDALRRTDELINQQGKLAAGFSQALLQFEAAESPAGGAAEQRPPVRIDEVRRAADDLNHLYKAAWNDFTARRYRQEARYNQRLAELYEVQVHR